MKGKYFIINGREDYPFNNMYYVADYKDGEYLVWLTASKHNNQPGMATTTKFTEEEFLSLIENNEISEIEPPTTFLVTHRDTYSIKTELKNAGAQWDNINQKWYFHEKPDKYKVKEVLVFPFTGKKV